MILAVNPEGHPIAFAFDRHNFWKCLEEAEFSGWRPLRALQLHDFVTVPRFV
jgi:hypothetical protein